MRFQYVFLKDKPNEIEVIAQLSDAFLLGCDQRRFVFLLLLLQLRAVVPDR